LCKKKNVLGFLGFFEQNINREAFAIYARHFLF